MKTFLRNFSSLALSDAGNRLLGFFATAYLARILGVEHFGTLNIGFTLLSYGMILTNPGIQLYATREVTKQGEKPFAFVGEIFSLRIILTLCVTLLLTIMVKIVFPSQEIFSLALLFLCSLFPFALLLEWFFQAKEQMHIISIGRIAGQVLYLLLVTVLVSSTSNILYVPLAWFCSGIVTTGILLVVYRRSQKVEGFKWNIISPLFHSNGRLRTILRESFPIGIGSWLAQLVTNFPPLAIAFLLSEREVGNFSAAYKVVFLCLMLDRIFIFLFYPIIIKTYAISKEKLQTTLSISLKIIVSVVLPLCIGGTVLAAKIIAFIYGAGYEGATGILQIAVWFVLLTTIHSIYSFGLIGIGEDKRFSKVMLTGTTSSFIFVLAGIYFLKSEGAAYGFVLGELLTLILMMAQFSTFVHVQLFRFFIRPLFASFVMVAVLMYAKDYPLIAQLLLGVIAYATIFYRVSGFTKSDIELLKESFS